MTKLCGIHTWLKTNFRLREYKTVSCLMLLFYIKLSNPPMTTSLLTLLIIFLLLPLTILMWTFNLSLPFLMVQTMPQNLLSSISTVTTLYSMSFLILQSTTTTILFEECFVLLTIIIIITYNI